MSVEYSKLWGVLKNKNMKKIELQRNHADNGRFHRSCR